MRNKLLERRPAAVHALVAMTLAALALASGAQAATIQFEAVIDGPSANGCLGTGSPATGLGLFTLDTVSHVVSYNVTYTVGSLLGPETASHVHGPAAACTSAGVVYGLPLGSPKIGMFTLTPQDEADMIAELHYVNIHSTVWGAGEIAGQIRAVTAGCSYTITPASGTVPFLTGHTVTLSNLYTEQLRRLAGRIDLQLANGSQFGNWRSGFTNIAAGASFGTSFNLMIPATGAVIGTNTFTLSAQDVTPSPFNQPPYPPAGDTCVSQQSVVANTP